MVSANFQNNNSNFNNNNTNATRDDVNTIQTVTLASEQLFNHSNDNTRNNKIELIPVESSQHHFLNRNSQDPSIGSISEQPITQENHSIEMEHALKEMNDTFSNLNASGILVENMVCNTNDETDGFNVNLTNEEFDDMVEELSSGGELSEEESKPVDQDLIIPSPTQKNDTNNTESSDTTALLSPNGGWLEKQLGQKPQPQIIPCGFKPQYEIPKYKPGPNYGPTSQAPQQELPRVQREKARSRQSSAANSNGNSLANSPEVSDADDADAFSDTETDVKPPHFLINNNKNSNNNPANEANNASTPGSPTATTATTSVSASEQLFNMNQGSSLSKETLEKVAIFLKEKEPCANSPLAAANYCPEEVLCLPTKEFNQFLKQNFSETQITLLKSSRRRMKNRLYAKGSRERKRPAKGSRTSPGVSPSPSNMGKAPSTARYNHRDRYEYSDTESPYSSLNSSPSSSPLSSPPSTPRHMNATAMEEYFSNKMKQKTSNKNMKPRHKTF